MTDTVGTIPMPKPPSAVPVSADTALTGPPIPPIERIKLFSAAQWEDFVLEWADSLTTKYGRVERCGGSGDMGRDVVATHADALEKWDNYQCKHYKDPLAPTHIWLELGKLVYYTFRGDFSLPSAYFFVAPQGAGTKLSNLLKKPEELKKGLINAWTNYCRNGITSKHAVELEGDLSEYVKEFDFSIFEAIPTLRMIDQHAETRWHAARFGGGLPQRPAVNPPPEEPTEAEVGYVRELFSAYSDHMGDEIQTAGDLLGRPDLNEHFQDSRTEFYSAESLRLFSRDTLPPGEYEKLQEEMHAGIRDEVRADHADGYRRVVEVIKTARSLQLSGHALDSRLGVRDRGGICHQLANDAKVQWVK